MPREGSLIQAIADTARVSYGAGTTRKRDDKGLVEYLIMNKHWSPFDQQKFLFRVHCPLFVRAQWYRHWSWDYNEESGRYSEVKEEYHIPSHLRVNDQKNRQATSQLLEDPGWLIRRMGEAQQDAYEGYQELLGAKVAREQARMVLPQSMYTTFRATCSLRQLIFFIQQRRDPHAQWEIRQYAEAIHAFLLERDVDLVNMLENHVWGARTMSGEVSRLLRLALQAMDRTEVGELLGNLGENDSVHLSKHEVEWLEGWLKYGG